jgi:hypothetical protein
MSSTLQDLVNRAVFYSTEVQTHFGGLIADAEWEVDFGSDPHLTFTSDDGVVLRARPHLLGSESSRDKTWLWGWENVNDFPDAVVGLSHDVRKFGAAEEVPELTTAELDLDEELALRLTLAAKVATGKWAHYPAEAGAGTTVWLLVDAAEITLPQPQVKVSVRALMQGLTQTTVSDHRAAIDAYVAERGIPVHELSDGGVRMLFADGSADLSFDDERRISNCDMNTPLEGEAAEQFAAASPASLTEAAPQEPSARSDSAAAAPTPAEPAETASSAETTSDASSTEDSHSATESTPAASASGADWEATKATTPVEAGASATDDTHSTQVPAERAETPAGDRRPGEEAEEKPVDESAEYKPAEENKPKKKGLFSKLFGR